MPRRCSVWDVVKVIKLLKAHKFSSEQIQDLLRPDLHIKERRDGSLVSDPSDVEIINYAYSENPEGPLHLKHLTNPESFFGYRPNLDGKGGGEK